MGGPTVCPPLFPCPPPFFTHLPPPFFHPPITFPFTHQNFVFVILPLGREKHKSYPKNWGRGHMGDDGGVPVAMRRCWGTQGGIIGVLGSVLGSLEGSQVVLRCCGGSFGVRGWHRDLGGGPRGYGRF